MGSQQDRKLSYGALEALYKQAVRDNARLLVEGRVRTDETEEALRQLDEMVSSADGYLRLGASPDGNFWVRYKWTKGKHSGTYIMGGHNHLLGAIGACVDEYLRVLDGKRAGIPDVGYRDRKK